MNSVCISSCVNDARVPVRATYRNLYKWPESDAEFVRSVSSNSNRSSSSNNNNNNRGVLLGHPRVVDSISCRQMYLRSYTFSRKETVPEKTLKCFGGVKEKVVQRKKKKRKGGGHGKKKCVVLRKVKEMSCAALFRIFHKLLSCTTSVDVADDRPDQS